jgi:hypothetical protein
MREVNPGNEALQQLRLFWDRIMVVLMRKAGLKELTIAPSKPYRLPLLHLWLRSLVE